jgi:hypothetical protein
MVGAGSDFGQPCLMRWWPEFQISRGVKFALVDAKSELRTDTANFSIETDALRCYRSIQRFNVQVLIVFPDMLVISADDAIAQSIYSHSGRGTNGAGTPFLLIPKAFARPFDKAFGDTK